MTPAICSANSASWQHHTPLQYRPGLELWTRTRYYWQRNTPVRVARCYLHPRLCQYPVGHSTLGNASTGHGVAGA
eukprot:916075-Rhodomonas_salina.1